MSNIKRGALDTLSFSTFVLLGWDSKATTTFRQALEDAASTAHTLLAQASE